MKILLGLLLFPLLSFGQSKEAVLHDYFNAVGGAENWKQVTSSKIKYSSWLNMPMIEGNAKQKRDTSAYWIQEAKSPNLKHVEFFSDSAMSSEFFYNEKGLTFLIGSEVFEKSNPPHFMVHDIVLNIMEQERLKELKYAGESEENGTKYWMLDGRSRPRDTVKHRFYFDQSTHLLSFSRFKNQGQSRITYYSDYRDVKGLMVAFREETFQNDKLFYKQVDIEVEFNPVIDNSIFYYKKPKRKISSNREPVSMPKFKDGDLNAFVYSNYQGKRVFIDLWATWCGPCKAEFNRTDSTYDEFMSSMNISRVYISIDKPDKRKDWIYDIHELQLGGDHFIAGPLLMESIVKDIYDKGQIVIPHYVLIDEKGNIVSKDFVRPSNKLFQDQIRKVFNTN